MVWHKSIELTPARMSDLIPLLKIMAECYAAENSALEWERAFDMLTRKIACPQRGPVWVLRAGNEFAGYVILHVIQEPQVPGTEVTVDELYVRPRFRNPEVNTKVTDCAIEFYRAAGIRTLHQRMGGQRYLLTTWL